MTAVTIYIKSWCPYCQHAKKLFESKGVPYQEIDVEKAPLELQNMIKRTQRRTVPQIFIGNHHIGGCDDLVALQQSNELDSLLKSHLDDS